MKGLMIKMICSLLLISALWGITDYRAKAVQVEGDFEYVQDDLEEEITIRAYTGDSAEDLIIVPDTINEWPVTTIDAGAFHFDDTAIQVRLPETVTRIEEGAFTSDEAIHLELLNPSVLFTDTAFSSSTGEVHLYVPGAELGTATAWTVHDLYSFTIHVDDNGNVSGDLNQLIRPGELASEVEANPNDGFRFFEWSDGRRQNPYQPGITEDTVLEAQFQEINATTFVIESGTVSFMEIGAETLTATSITNILDGTTPHDGNNEFSYFTQTFVPSENGYYAIGNSNATVDTAMLFYEGAFDPTDIRTNYRSFNDDYRSSSVNEWYDDGADPSASPPPPIVPDDMSCGPSGAIRCPAVELYLTAGTTYTIVTSTFRSYDEKNVNTLIDFPLTFFIIGPSEVTEEAPRPAPRPSAPSAPPRTVDVIGDSEDNAIQSRIERSTVNNRIIDRVSLQDQDVSTVLDQLLASGRGTASMVIHDEDDEIDEIEVSFQRNHARQFEEAEASLEILTTHGSLRFTPDGGSDLDDELYFRLMPDKRPLNKQSPSASDRLSSWDGWQRLLQTQSSPDDSPVMISRSTQIETNYQGQTVEVRIPLSDEQAESLDDRQLFVIAEHSDGSIERLLVTLSEYHDGRTAAVFETERFSTFTIWSLNSRQLNPVPFVQGSPTGHFSPDESVTWAALAAMLMRQLEGGPSEEPATPLYDHWSDPYLQQMLDNGLLTMQDLSVIHPDEQVNRAAFTRLLVEWIRLFDADLDASGVDPHQFDDIRPSHWAYDEIQTAYAHGLINGYPNGEFRPHSAISRAEAVSMILRWLPLETTPSSPVRRYTDVPQGHWAYEAIMTASRTNN